MATRKVKKGKPTEVSMEDIGTAFGSAAVDDGATPEEVAEIKETVLTQDDEQREVGAPVAGAKQLVTFANGAARREYQRVGVNGFALADHLSIRSVRAYASEHGSWTAEALQALRRVDDSAPDGAKTKCVLCPKEFTPEAIRLILPKFEGGRTRFILLARGDKPEWAGSFAARKEVGSRELVLLPACGTLSDPESCVNFLREVKETRVKDGVTVKVYFTRRGPGGKPMLDKHNNPVIDRKPAVTYESGMAYIASVKERGRLAAEEAERGRLAAEEAERNKMTELRGSRLGALTHRARVTHGNWK